MTTNAKAVMKAAREAFESGRTRPYEFRRRQLEQLRKMVHENDEKIAAALYKDLRKCKMEAFLTEIDIMKSELDETISHLKGWMAPESKEKSVLTLLDDVKVYSDPLGVVLVIGTWNYPFNIVFTPVLGAIAAGNCVVIKPSELAPHTANCIAELVPKYLDNECYPVFLGGPQEITALLEEKFDHIMFTGSTQVGKMIYAAAQKHLTPVTLELGGKSPLYLDDTVDMSIAAKRIFWGKFVNAGQTCIAPDYILCTKEVEDKFLAEAKSLVDSWYGKDPSKSNDFCRIITDRHFKRLVSLIDANKVALGGTYDSTERYIAPTILRDCKLSDPVMKDEIFGPILPIVRIGNLQEAISFINKLSRPLSLYIFSSDKKVQDLILNNTISGSVVVNDTVLQFAVSALPFGGVGDSGMGRIHGKYSFDSFSHKKACLAKNYGFLGEKLGSARYPPYTAKKLSFMQMMIHQKFGMGIVKHFRSGLIFAVGLTLGLAGSRLLKDVFQKSEQY